MVKTQALLLHTGWYDKVCVAAGAMCFSVRGFCHALFCFIKKESEKYGWIYKQTENGAQGEKTDATTCSGSVIVLSFGLYKVCPVSAGALTMLRWRAGGVS